MSAAVAPGYTIHVAGLAPETTEEKLHDFFSFCGKLVSVKKTGSTAEITFEKLSAMRTSLMLNGGTLDGAHLEVTSASDVEPKASVLPTGASGSTPIGAGIAGSSEISQEDKPKAAIIAEYLAHGYVMGDHVIQRAIDLDQKQGISTRFLDFFHSLDKSVGAKVVGEDKTVSEKINEHAAAVVGKAREVDQNRGVSAKFSDYYHKVLGTPIGQRVHSFYTTTQKQVLDVHEEARRIADEKKAAQAAAGTTASAPASEPAAVDDKTPLLPATGVPPVAPQ
ncbi:hypothetical protein DB88DRAFT_484502 [Papiliotrema laurentii]|uniref:RRM domain-containing protein n=1 Tax=Papiliotrema laurentii TaxID=5418 RepID=A0AAD9L747_PAPLA|nr:hypothetical protein DB88DRAFT_484502 [Papiliotrema laurentii]